MSITESRQIGVRIRRARKRLGVTQQELAMTSGTGVRFIIDLEQGKESCRLGLTLKVLHTLGIEMTLNEHPYANEGEDSAGD